MLLDDLTFEASFPTIHNLIRDFERQIQQSSQEYVMMIVQVPHT